MKTTKTVDVILAAENTAAHDKRNAARYAAHAIFEAAGKTPKARRIYFGVCAAANATYEATYDVAYAASVARRTAAVLAE